MGFSELLSHHDSVASVGVCVSDVDGVLVLVCVLSTHLLLLVFALLSMCVGYAHKMAMKTINTETRYADADMKAILQ